MDGLISLGRVLSMGVNDPLLLAPRAMDMGERLYPIGDGYTETQDEGEE